MTVHRVSAVLALLALALQFTVSFAHYHAEDFFPITAAGPAGPARQIPVPSTDDHCAICLDMQMIAASALPPPIVPSTPSVVAFVAYEQAAIAVPRPAPRRHYRSRDPPLV
jgi:hypothetical protein